MLIIRQFISWLPNRKSKPQASEAIHTHVFFMACNETEIAPFTPDLAKAKQDLNSRISWFAELLFFKWIMLRNEL